MSAPVKTSTGHWFSPDEAWQVWNELRVLLGQAEFPEVEVRTVYGPPARQFSQHRNDSGDWCPWSLVSVPADASEHDGCPARCNGSEIVPVDPDPADAERVFWCPRCDKRIDVHDVDLALRDSRLDLEADENGELFAKAGYDGYGDYDTLVYQCAACLKPVRLPERLEVIAT